MSSYDRYSLGCIHRFQFRARLGSPWRFSVFYHIIKLENDPVFYLRKILIISCNLDTGIEVYS
jgi:hypothetical protein